MAAVLLGLTAGLFAQEIAPLCAPKSSGLSFNCWRDKAKPNPNPKEDSVPAEVRSARDMAEDRLGVPFRLDEPGAEAKVAALGNVFNHFGTPDPFPATSSDLIAVVTFNDFVPRLSQSHYSLYTELSFKVDDVLKAAGVKKLAGDSFTTILEGGAIRLAGGKTIRYFPSGADDLPLKPGARYLVFLKYVPQTDTFEILKHWGLSGGRLIITDLTEMERAAKGNPAIRPDTREADIVERIRSGKF